MSSSSAIETENKVLVRRWFEEVWNQGRADLIDELRAGGAVSIGLGEGKSESRGDTPFKIFHSNLRAAFPDLHVHLDDVLAEGDKVVVRFTFDGTHRGDALGVPPTGRKVSFIGMLMARIAEGKIAESWNSLDQLGLMLQIGALPAGSVRQNFLITRP
jgi:predicted ester cyclase